MAIAIICLLLLMAGWLVFDRAGVWDTGTEIVGIFGMVFGGIGVLMVATTVPIERSSAVSMMAQIRAIEQTAAAAREDGHTWELAAMQTEIAEANAWIAKAKHWNGTMFDVWWPDEVEKLKPIR